MFITRTVRPSMQQGDTIVEVLISIAVISMILGGAYVTTNRSLLATRSAQEHSSALKLAESQVEQLKGLITEDPAAVFGGGAPSPFCVYTDTATSQIELVASTDTHCSVNTAGAPTTAEPRYRLSITRSGNDFTVVNRWTNIRGKNTDELQLKYRLYE